MEKLKSKLKYVRDVYLEKKLLRFTSKNGDDLDLEGFDFNGYRENVMSFVRSMRHQDSFFRYRFSKSADVPTLYGSIYACLIFGMFGELSRLEGHKRQEWLAYFNSFQNPDTGLFYDNAVNNELYSVADWWGARHLALHIICAYTALGGRPTHQFKFLSEYYSEYAIQEWLEAYDWNSSAIFESDVDNKIMNIASLLQYQRDFWDDKGAGEVVSYLKKYLLSKLNVVNGVWGEYDSSRPDLRSRSVQFAYHLLPLFFYDGFYGFHAEKIVKEVLNTQNKLGGFGVKLNSSACEDIDSLYILLKFEPRVSKCLKPSIHEAIGKGFRWVMKNQMKDGGYVFRINEPLRYGHKQTSSAVNESSMFPTWFRVLSIAQIVNNRNEKMFKIDRTPGLVFP